MRSKEEEISEAALRLFGRHGYRKVTMVDIAEAAAMSRPTLYAAFGSKEAIFAAMLDRERERHAADSERQLREADTLRAKLERLCDIWIIQPFTQVIGSENGTDLLTNCSVYAPEAAALLYGRFETYLAETLRPAMTTNRQLTADDLAHILMLASRGLKASTETLPEFQRLMAGLITMTVATVEQR